MSFPENPTLENTRIGRVIDSVKSTFEDFFADTTTNKILGGTSCDDENVNYLVCIFYIDTPSTKIIVDSDYLTLHANLYNFSNIKTDDYRIEDMKVEFSDTIKDRMKVSFNVRCTF